MPLQNNATMIFISYEIQDGGIQLHFVCPNPGAGEPNDYYILLTDDELTTVGTVQQLKTLVEGKLQRKLRAVGIATKLDTFIGQSLVV